MAFRGGLAKMLIRDSLRFARTCIALAGLKLGEEWWNDVFGSLASLLSTVGVAPLQQTSLTKLPGAVDAGSSICGTQKRNFGHGIGRGDDSERNREV